MGTINQEVWEEPDPIKVVALEQAVKFYGNVAANEKVVVSGARIFESYLREKDPEPEPTYLNP